MKKIIIGVLAVLILGGSALYLTLKDPVLQLSNPQDEQKQIIEGSFAPQTNDGLSGSGTFRKILALGKSVQCTIAYTLREGGAVTGTIYVSGDKMRGDFSTTGSSTAMQSHMITNSAQSYLWGKTAEGEMAIRFPVNKQEATTNSGASVTMDTDVDYSCKNWKSDESVFTPPSDIQFMDMGDMMPAVTGGGASGKMNTEDLQALQCRSCELIPDGPEKTQCEETFSCK